MNMEVPRPPILNGGQNLIPTPKKKISEKVLFLGSIFASLLSLVIFWLYLYINIANGAQSKGEDTLIFLTIAIIIWVVLCIPTVVLFFYNWKKATISFLPFVLVILFFVGSAIAMFDYRIGATLISPYRNFALWSTKTINDPSPNIEKSIQSSFSQNAIFTSMNGSYSFEYPKELNVRESTGNFANLSNQAKTMGIGVFEYGPESFIKDGKKNTPSEFLNYVTSDYGRKKNIPTVGIPITIAGENAWKTEQKNGDGNTTLELIAVYKGNILYLVSAYGLTEKTLETLFRTFKFTTPRTWTDPVSGFSFEYPSVWVICDNSGVTNTDFFEVIIAQPETCNTRGEFQGVMVRIKKGSEPVPLDEYADTYGKLEPVTVNGLTLKRHMSRTYSPTIASVAFQRDGLWYAVDAKKIGDNALEQIYSSFRFIEQ